MAFTLTFLGKGGTGRTTAAIAAAKAMASQGQRVLLLGHEMEHSLKLLLNQSTLTPEPQELESNLSIALLSTTLALEHGWDELKKLEAQYVRTPFFKTVFGQELGVLPGMDAALSLYKLRTFDKSERYDIIVYDAPHSIDLLRMFGLPEVIGWYLRRFRQVFAESDLGKALSPFLQPVAATILNNADWTSGNFAQPFALVDGELSQVCEAIADPNRTAAYLITNEDPIAIQAAQYFWGSAQQVNLTVGGILLNQSTALDLLQERFAALPMHALPHRTHDIWLPLTDSLPNVRQEVLRAPRPMTIDVAQRQVKLFLPGFAKNQVQLTQYGPELTIAAGDQRRNLFLPQALMGQKVTGAKFQDGYLTISF
jgi:arsenite-transporting ATPase